MKRPTPAAKSVLLDYVSPIQPVALVIAIKNKHLAVGAVIFVSTLFKGLIVASTGLITLSPQAVRHENYRITTVNSFVNNKTALENIRDLPYKTMENIQTQNLSSPDGTNKEFAFQTFQPPLGLVNPVLSTVVDGFTSTLECQIADLKVIDFYWDIPYRTPASVPPQLVSH
ncbi:hypothetical protein AOQ84DRAFT_223045 [Glonium stellatum]|uniref:Uncharacterized protein n=1 Tax=Glonium stellatum TaxID=574774 RepID=A0A8E2EYH0_9PEZI|nr:hypothetical protein AOQ84DRAFT_223045 [Glonium stellatum]